METPRYSDDNRSLHRSKLGLLCEKAISSHCLVVSNEFYLVSSQIYTTKVRFGANLASESGFRVRFSL